VNTADQWSDFFVASVGASAALAGLVMVAISVNVKAILDGAALPARAASTVAVLVLILACTSVGLIKAQSLRDLGVELLIFGLVGMVPALHSTRAGLRVPDRPWPERVFHIVVGQATQALFLVAGGLLIAENSTGYFWIVAAVITGYVVSTLNAWVLLIEILR
jgi:membrane-associated PAP2 superfamily phosphatase